MACLAGCGAAATDGSPASLPAATAISATGTGPASTSAASSLSTSPARAIPPTVPLEFAKACGNPGTAIVLTHVPVTVKHRDCDLSDVTIRIGENGMGAVVPAPGEQVSGVADVSAGDPQPAEINISVDAKTGDVTVSE